MSLYESLPFSSPDHLARRAIPFSTGPAEVEADPAERLSDALADVFIVRKTESAVRSRAGRRVHEPAIILSGQLIGTAEAIYPTIAERLRGLGYTAMLERYKGEDVVVAVPGIMLERTFNPPWWVHLVLLLVTIVSTVLAGEEFGGYISPTIFNPVRCCG